MRSKVHVVVVTNASLQMDALVFTNLRKAKAYVKLLEKHTTLGVLLWENVTPVSDPPMDKLPMRALLDNNGNAYSEVS